MYVGGGDRAALLGCFDETATAVFATLCQLCAGDSEHALELLNDTYAYVQRVADSSGGLDVDRQWMVDAAHSVYVAKCPQPSADEMEPVASLDVTERVVVHLYDVEGRSLPEIGVLLGASEDEVQRILTKGRAVLAPIGGVAPAKEAFRRGEVWFDDVMRTEARERLEDPPAPPETPAETDPPPADGTHILMSRRVLFGATAAGAIAVLVGLGLWVASSETDEEAARELDLPEGPATSTTTTPDTTLDTTAPTSPDTTSPDTTPFTVDPAAPEETIVLDSDGTVVSEEPRVRRAGFIIDPVPDGLAPAGGYFYLEDAGPAKWFQLWATADAQHNTGRWLAMFAMRVAWNVPQSFGPDTRRMELSGRGALVRTSLTGVSSITSTIADGAHVEMQTYGFTTDEVGALLDSMTLGTNNEPRFSARADPVLDGLDLRISRRAGGFDPFRGAGVGDYSAHYSSADGNTYVTVTAGQQRDDDLFATALLGEPSADPVAVTYAPNGVIDIAGRQTLIRSFDDPFLQWHDGNYTVTLSGNMGLSALFDLAARTRLATVDEWQAQRRTIPPSTGGGGVGVEVNISDDFVLVGESEVPPGIYTFVSIATPAAEPVEEWRLQIRRSPTTGDDADPGTFGTVYTSVVPDPEQPITVFLDLNATTIVGLFESPGLATTLRVSVNGQPATYLPLVRLGDTQHYGVAYSFSETAAFDVALVDSHGSLIRPIDV